MWRFENMNWKVVATVNWKVLETVNWKAAAETVNWKAVEAGPDGLVLSWP